MRIAACIVLFHPDPKDLERDIRAIAPYLDTLILWRNSGEETSLPQDISCPVVYMGDGTNQYIAHALNESLAYCAEFGFDCLLTMDQDSEFEDFGAFLEQAESLRRDPAYADAIIFAPNVNRRYGTEEKVLPVESTITSGSLCDVRKCLAIGGFRESYRIYWVDSEFCHRAALAGYRILALPGHNLRQQFGKITKKHGIDCYNYSAKTYYFMFRNMLWMHREYKSNPSTKCVLYTTQMYLKSILAGENGKWEKLKAVCRGIRHGLTRDYR